MNEEDRSVWEFTIGLGLPDTAPGEALETDGIHPIALLLEESAHRVRGVNRIPCFTSYGPAIARQEFAQRAWGEDFGEDQTPVECRLAVYVTDDELDELAQALAEDLGLTRDGYSMAAGKTITVDLRPIPLEPPQNRFYLHLVDQYRNLDSPG
ncbi:hypothetical protein [Nocardia shimofusensis]|uniref:hypothetical protein n=1 Tax=Nocardia shimofusensis TaxID=228596 RepID=UPI000830BC4B|nr:hypothetical protein [Nocardia shimofusensis]